MNTKGIGDMLKLVKQLAPGIQGINKQTQKDIALMRVKRKLLGPIVDLYYDLKSNVDLVVEVFGSFGKMLGSTLKVLGPFGKAISVVAAGFKGIGMSVIFLIGLFLAVSAVLIGLTGSFAEAQAMFPQFYAGFESIKASIMESIGHLETIGAAILAIDWGPLLEAAGFAIGGIILLLVNFYSAGFAFISDILGIFAELFTFMSETGAFDSIIAGVAGIMNAFTLAFSYIFQILDVFGINFTNIFGLVSAIFGGWVSFLMDSGILEFFATLIEFIGWILPPVVFVVGEILLLAAKIIMFFVGPLVTGIVGALKIVIKIIAGVIKVFLFIFTGAMNVVMGIGNWLFDFFTGGWRDTWDNMKKMVSGWIESFMDLISPITSFMSGIFGSIEDAIMSFIDVVRGPLEDIFGFIGDGVSGVMDAVGGVIGGVGGAIGSVFAHSGGVFSGPAGGYPATLHGTEAVVPLPDGKSIPVTMQGMKGAGGGDDVTVNINVSGGGNAREIAKAVSTEVQRVFRNRSRSGGFGRGVI